MKISAKIRYGARAMLEPALHHESFPGDGSPLSAAQIAKRQRISVKYLEQLIAALKASGLIRSTCGARGEGDFQFGVRIAADGADVRRNTPLGEKGRRDYPCRNE